MSNLFPETPLVAFHDIATMCYHNSQEGTKHIDTTYLKSYSVGCSLQFMPLDVSTPFTLDLV